MKNKILIICVLISSIQTMKSQQDISLSMYMFNPLFTNPATAGYQDRQWLSGIGRYQWVGITGAPRSAVVSYQTPLKNNNLAIGALVKYDDIGLMKNVGMDLSFAYRIKISELTKLSLGLMASMFNYNDARRDAITNQPLDPTAITNVSAWIPNFGFGAYMFSDKYFVGASIPHMLSLKIADQDPSVVGSTVSKIYNHYFASAGYVFGKPEGIKFKPTTFFKISENSSPNIDINGNILLQERFWFGLGYRSGGDVISEKGDFKQFGGLRGESVVATFKMMATNNLEIGYAYDYPLSNLNNSTSGSHEMYVGMDLGKTKSTRYVSPRYVHYF